MKLLQINITANWGSTGKIAEQIGLVAMKHGWESYVAYGRWANPSQSHLIKVGNMMHSVLHYAEQRIFDNEGLCSSGPTKGLVKQIEKIQPDIIHLHNIHDHYLNYKILFEFLQEYNHPVVWTFHDCWAFTGHCFHFVTQQCYRWKTGCYECPLRNVSPQTLLDCSRQHWELKKKYFGGCKNLTIIPVSKWMEDFVHESFLKDCNILTIHNGIDLNVFRPMESTAKTQDVMNILGVASVWSTSKGLADFIKLRRLLPENYHITLIGLSKTQIRQLPEGIVGIERTNNVEELVEYYNKADVFVNSTYEDSFPTVNLEALACGTPVITYRTGGSPEAIDERTGVVIEQCDVDGLADAIREMKSRPLSSSACRQRAELLWNKDKCFEAYIDLYERLVRL